MVKTIDVAGGQLLPDVSMLDGPACLARKREVEQALASTRNDPRRAEERTRLRLENEALDARLRELREMAKRENARRNFAGIGSPLHEAMVERLAPDVVADLEQEAMRRLAERERRSAERRAKNGATVPTTVPGSVPTEAKR